MRFDSSIQIESEDSTQVLELSQNVDMKTQLDDQSTSCFFLDDLKHLSRACLFLKS